MGNCQAAEAATVVIQHPGNSKIERIYWSVSANEVMTSNPGHYVAMVVTSSTTTTTNTNNNTKFDNGAAASPPLKQLKLLRPDDTLLIGHVYRLISFEGDVNFLTFKIFHILFTLVLICFTYVYVGARVADVLKEFAAKRCVKLGRLLERGGLGLDTMRKGESGGSNPSPKSDHNYNTNNKPIKVHYTYTTNG